MLCDTVFVFQTSRGQFQNIQNKGAIDNTELLQLFQAEENESVTMD